MPCTNTSVSSEFLALPVRFRQVIWPLWVALSKLSLKSSETQTVRSPHKSFRMGVKRIKVPTKISRVLPVLSRAKVKRILHISKA